MFAYSLLMRERKEGSQQITLVPGGLSRFSDKSVDYIVQWEAAWPLSRRCGQDAKRTDQGGACLFVTNGGPGHRKCRRKGTLVSMHLAGGNSPECPLLESVGCFR
jgi:hypothetical protein